MTATKIWTLRNLTFLSNFFPAKAPAIAARVTDTSKTRFLDKPEEASRDAYTDNRVMSTNEAMITPVAINASFERPLFMRNALLKSP